MKYIPISCMAVWATCGSLLSRANVTAAFCWTRSHAALSDGLEDDGFSFNNNSSCSIPTWNHHNTHLWAIANVLIVSRRLIQTVYFCMLCLYLSPVQILCVRAWLILNLLNSKTLKFHYYHLWNRRKDWCCSVTDDDKFGWPLDFRKLSILEPLNHNFKQAFTKK